MFILIISWMIWGKVWRLQSMSIFHFEQKLNKKISSLCQVQKIFSLHWEKTLLGSRQDRVQGCAAVCLFVLNSAAVKQSRKQRAAAHSDELNPASVWNGSVCRVTERRKPEQETQLESNMRLWRDSFMLYTNCHNLPCHREPLRTRVCSWFCVLSIQRIPLRDTV